MSSPEYCNLDLTFDEDECKFRMTGEMCLPEYSIDVDIPDMPNIPCANGFTTSGGLDVTCGGQLSTSTPEVSVATTSPASCTLNLVYDEDQCEFAMVGELCLPEYSIDVDIPDVPNVNLCSELQSTGAVTISGGNITTSTPEVSVTATTPAVDIDLSFDECELKVTGGVTVPDITVDVNLPDCPECNVFPNLDITSDVTIETTDCGGTAGGTLTLTGDGHELTLTGTITIPVPDMCSSDYSEVTLDVCQPGGGTSSITVLTKN